MRDKVKRFISILMTALMLVNLMPVGALADGITSGGYQQATVASTTYGAWVYVYAKLTGEVPGTTENAHGWYTLGKKWVDNIPDPADEDLKEIYGYGEISGVSVNSVINGMQRYTANENITPSAYIKSAKTSEDFGFKICDGATDYVSGIKTWHLNLQINVANIQGKCTFHFKENQWGTKIKDSVTVTGNWNTKGSYTAPTEINYNGYVYKLIGAATKSYTFNTYQQEYTFQYRNTGRKAPYTLKIYYYYDSVSDVNLISKDVLSENPYTKNNIKYGDSYSVTSPTIIGYKPDKSVVDGWMPSHDVTVNVIYTRKNDLRYTVKYLETGTNKKLLNAKTVENQPLHKLVTEEAPDIEGYKLVSESPKSITITERTNEIIFYYTKKADLSYTVEYHWNGTKIPGVESDTVGGQTFGAKVTVTPKTIDGYTLIPGQDLEIEIGANNKDNVLVLNYYKNVTLTANSATLPYNGEAQSVSGFTGAPEGSDFSAIEVGATGTLVGEYTAEFAEGTVGTVDKTGNYVVKEANPGKLTITAVTAEVVVTITEHSGTATYDGKEHTVTGYDVTKISNPLYKGTDFTFSGNDSVSGINAGTYNMELKPADFTNNNANFAEVKFVIVDGALTINPAEVTLTANSATLPYNGEEQSVSGFTGAPEGSDFSNITVGAKGTNVGEYPAKFAEDTVGTKDKTGNYVVKEVENGKLTISPAEVTLTANSDTKTYNGQEQGVSGFTGAPEGSDFSNITVGATGTLVGEYPAEFAEDTVGKLDTTGNYIVAAVVPGLLTITDGTGEKEKPVDPAKVITKTHTPKDMGYNLGETVTFTVSVTNIYNEQKEVTLEEQPGVTFVDPQGAAIGTTATKTLEPGETWTIQATYKITSADILADGFTNTVKAIFGDKSWTAKDDVETRDPYIELDVTKTADVDKAALGQTITYTITVDYQSNVPGKKVEVKDPLTGLETSFTTEEALEGKIVTFTTTYTVTEQDVKNGIVRNTATVKSELDNEWTPADVEIPTFAPITIKPKDVTATYNGAAITGKDVEITSGKLLEGHKLSAAVIGSGVNAGTYELTLDKEKIKIVDADNNDVSKMYACTRLPGKLTIAKRSVLITSQSATKTYDGSALTRPAVTITGDGFVPGELAKAEATGSITKVGSTANTIQYTTTGAFNAANYSIALSVGTLTVTEKPQPEPRRTFNLTINYVYQNGKRAAASYNRGGLKNGETFDITSPVIAGYTASETVVSGTIYNRDIKVTVIYTADGVNLDDYGVPLGLGNITMNVGDCFE